MGLYEFFYPHAAQAEALQSIARTMGRATQSGKEARRDANEIDEGLGTLTLVVLGLVAALVEKGAIRREDLHEQLRRIDGIDGAADGRVDPAQVFAVLGFAPPPPPPPQAPVPRRTRR
jgi:hypothetical protein